MYCQMWWHVSVISVFEVGAERSPNVRPAWGYTARPHPEKKEREMRVIRLTRFSGAIRWAWSPSLVFLRAVSTDARCVW